jgi:hypothetical protein
VARFRPALIAAPIISRPIAATMFSLVQPAICFKPPGIT